MLSLKLLSTVYTPAPFVIFTSISYRCLARSVTAIHFNEHIVNC